MRITSQCTMYSILYRLSQGSSDHTASREKTTTPSLVTSINQNPLENTLFVVEGPGHVSLANGTRRGMQKNLRQGLH
jgi:hypothetical protein